MQACLQLRCACDMQAAHAHALRASGTAARRVDAVPGCRHCRYNAQAHVNRGVVLLEAGNLEDARQAFCDAAAIQPLCVQALYNLG